MLGTPHWLLRQILLILAALTVSMAVVTGLAGILDLAGAEEGPRTARKILVPLFMVVWILLLRLPRQAWPEWLGWPTQGRHPARLVATGLAFGAASVILMQVGLYAGGARVMDPSYGWGRLAVKTVGYLFAALVLGLLEETLFRGVLHRSLRVDSLGWRGWGLGLLSAALFAAAHFLRPTDDRPVEGWWDTGIACLAALGTIPPRWPEAFGLLLVGLVLMALRKRTGSIWLSVGVHAGWVWIQKAARRLVDEDPEAVAEHPFWIGSERVYDGIAGWLALLLTFGLCLLWLRPKSESVDERSP